MTRKATRCGLFLLLLSGLGLLACGAPGTEDQVAPATETLGVRADGDTEISPDLSQVPEELQQVFEYIDDNVDEHVMNLRRWIQQPSISNSGEGIPESAQMVKGFFDQLGCQHSQVYEIPMTEWGQPGNPVVYANCDYGKEHTILIYWMYDTMPITQPEAWVLPPVRWGVHRVRPLQEGDDRPGRHELQGPPDGAVERVPLHPGSHRHDAGEPDLHR